MPGAGSFNVYYDPATELINMVATLNNQSYGGWGWGKDMTNTEMVIFSANGNRSGISTVYGVGTTDPRNDNNMMACYSSSFVQDTAANTVTITATRPLDCGITDAGGDQYVVQLDQSLRLVTAWNPRNSRLSFHGNDFTSFTQEFLSTGEC